MSIIIKWDLFRQNSSTEDALWEIANGHITTWAQWLHATWPEDCKNEIKRMRKAHVTWASVQRRAKRICRLWGLI